MTRPLALLLALAALPAAALEAGPQSNACRQALAALQARESSLAGVAQAAASQPAPSPRVAADAQWRSLRAQAARACLGAEPDAPTPLPHSAMPPIAVPPISIITPPTLPRGPSSATPAPPMSIAKPPPTVTSCDPGGCWTSDGARMPRVGRNPPDPVGRCNPQGNVVVCL